MKTALGILIGVATPVLKTRQALMAENLALRQRLATRQGSVKRPALSAWDRLFWALLAARCGLRFG